MPKGGKKGGGKGGKKGGGKKMDNNKKNKIIEDKTFGLKNKKGKKVQNLQNQYRRSLDDRQKKMGGGRGAGPTKSKKQLKAEKAAEYNKIFKPVMAKQAYDKNVDPKTVVCGYYKAGTCTKGAKCKFSHDLSMERKQAKRNVFHDARDSKKEDSSTMETWDERKVREVINKKKKGQRCASSIVCKHFINAIEGQTYGWFWECPNGGDDCQYRHALPKGYVFKKDRKKAEEKEAATPMEELLEEERRNLGTDLTPVTYERFLEWKEKKRKEKEAAAQARRDAIKKGTVQMTGMELFAANRELFVDDEGASTETLVQKREKEIPHPGVLFNASLFSGELDPSLPAIA